MTAILLALVSALAYGVSDFAGGTLSKSRPVWMVTVAGQITAALATTIFALFMAGDPAPADFGWGAVAGVASGIGVAFLYRGLSQGRMGVVAPVSAIGAAILPVAWGLVSGDQPSVLAWIGIIVAFPAIYLVARTEDPAASLDGDAASTGALDGVLAGIGFGVMFVAVSEIGDDAGLFPLAGQQVVAGLAVITVAAAIRQPWVPRGRAALLPMVFGPAGSIGLLCFLLATHQGLLSVVSVIASLYPASTVLLAAVLLGERIGRLQALGLALAMIAVGCVALN